MSVFNVLCIKVFVIMFLVLQEVLTKEPGGERQTANLNKKLPLDTRLKENAIAVDKVFNHLTMPTDSDFTRECLFCHYIFKNEAPESVNSPKPLKKKGRKKQRKKQRKG